MLTLSVDLNRPVPAYSISLDTPVQAQRNPLGEDWSKLLNVSAFSSAGFRDRKSILDDLRSFCALQDGWIGPGSLKIPVETIEKVSSVVHLLEEVKGLPNPEVTPTQNGTISFEWESNRGEVHIEFGKTLISAFVRVEDSPTVYIKNVASLQPSFYAEVRDLLFPLTETYSITIPRTAFDGNVAA